MGLAGYAPDAKDEHPEERPRPFVAFKGAEKLTPEQRREVQDFILFKLRQRRRAEESEDA